MDTFTTVYERDNAFYEGPDDGFIKVDVKDVGSSVQAFAGEVANKLWNIEFYVSELWPPHQTTKLYIHTKGQPFFLGRIYREGNKFGVWSRRIRNNKKPNAAESVNFKTALRNAAKHLQLWDVAELAGRPAYKYALERRKRIQAVSSEAIDALTRIGVVDEKAPVFKYLLTEINGNRYVGEELRADVEMWMSHTAVAFGLQNSGRFPLFVYVSKDTNNYDCMDVMNVDVDVTYSGSVRTTMARRLHDWDALFQQLLPKLSVLNVMSAGEYVNGAGMKYSDNMFLVVSEEGDGVT